jgi:hypothetical protein
MRRRNLLFIAASGVAISQLPQYVASNTQTPRPSPTPPPEASDTASIRAMTQVDWSSFVAQTTPMLFGCNDYEVMTPEKAADPEFRQQMARLDFRLMRLHNAKMSDRWSNPQSRRWSPEKIQESFQAATYLKTPTLVQNIPNWTQWMQRDGEGRLAESEYDRYAQFCAELVDLLNRRQGRKIKFWEPINEAEPIYERTGSLDRLWEIYNRAAKAMKAVDPTIQVGGPVISWSEERQMRSFMNSAAQNVDFLSWHRYASGNPRASSDRLMEKTLAYGKDVRTFRAMAKEYDRQIPLFLGEYSLNYDWKSGETRQHSNIGAVWFASVLKHLAESAIDMAAVWHAKDGVYGLIDPQDNLRPAAKVYEWGLDYLVGKTMATDSDHPMVETWAVEQSNGDRTVLIINKAGGNAEVKLNWPRDDGYQEQLVLIYLNSMGHQAFSYTMKALQEEQFSLMPYSLLLVRSKKREP